MLTLVRGIVFWTMGILCVMNVGSDVRSGKKLMLEGGSHGGQEQVTIPVCPSSAI